MSFSGVDDLVQAFVKPEHRYTEPQEEINGVTRIDFTDSPSCTAV